MSKTSKIIVSVLLIGILLIGIGYASIQNITLSITGTAEANPNPDNFKVMFSGEPTVSDEDYVTAAITDDINATINVEGLTEKGQTVSAIYTVQNVSTDISADLSVSTTNDNPEYFTLSSRLEKTSLVAGEATTLTVTVELTKIPITDEVTSTIGVQLLAIPVEPGQEGTSEGLKDSSQTPEMRISNITNDNIGEYIDLGNNIIGTENTSDDWRILYKEGETVYAILADYLPAIQVPETTGLSTDATSYPYSVWTNNGRDALLDILLNQTAWSDFANEIPGATVTGSPTAELLMNSYNTKTGTELVYTDSPTLDNTIEDYDLYVPHTEIYESCSGYRLATKYESDSYNVWYVLYNGEIAHLHPQDSTTAIRPVIALPSNIAVKLVNEIWTVIK